MRRKFLKVVTNLGLVLAALGLIQGPRVVQAQTTFGTIVGTVTDPSEASIPDVAITVTNMQTGIARQVITDRYGNYRVVSLLPGVYRIKAEHEGFQATEITNVELQVDRTITQNVVMQVGGVTQTLEVTAAPPLLDAATSTVGTVIDNQNVITLPLNGRNYTDLILLVPGSVPRPQSPIHRWERT
jgi:hypothetical protein